MTPKVFLSYQQVYEGETYHAKEIRTGQSIQGKVLAQLLYDFEVFCLAALEGRCAAKNFGRCQGWFGKQEFER